MIARTERPDSEAALREALAAGAGAGDGAERSAVLSGSSLAVAADFGSGSGSPGAGSGSPGSDATAPVLVSTERMADVLELRRRDFTVTVQPGLRLARLRQLVEAEGLWLPAGGPGAARSVGGWIAAGSPGPWDPTFGPVRRQLLACRVATHDGRLLSWGRAVMKNVAGYDLPRLMAGSRGRLGALAGVTLRLWPRPAAIDAVEAAAAPERLETLVAELEAAGTDALTWTWDAETGHRLRAVLAGSASSVARRRRELVRRAREAGADPGEAAAETPGGPSGPTRAPGSIAFRWTPGRRYLARGVRGIAETAGPRPTRIVAWPGTGVLQAEFPAGPDGAALLPGPDHGPVAIERGGPAAHAESERRRPAASRAVEARVAAALGGRPRSWQADYV